jgi:hypothetical protein
MNMTSKIATLVAAVMALGLFAGSAMAAAYPTSVGGTWRVQANQSTGSLIITTEGTIGPCRSISGTLFGDNIVGFYCKNTGRFNFVRNDINGVTFQVYSGNVSMRASNVYMGGIFSSVLSAQGEYNFSAIKP